MAAFKAAREDGALWIETDVKLTQDPAHLLDIYQTALEHQAAPDRPGKVKLPGQRTGILARNIADNERALELAGLTHRRDMVAGAISHGEQRQLEVAMTLATEPQVILLDEPLAGMGTVEAERMVELLQRLKADHAVMLVEHDMDAVFALADRLTVMVNGQVIASGTPEAIRADANVQAAYLGEEH